MESEPRASYSLLLRQNPSEFSTQYFSFQSGFWEQAVALCVLGSIPLILLAASLALVQNCMCWL